MAKSADARDLSDDPVTLLRAALRSGTKNPSELIHIGSSPITPTIKIE